jgi:type III pantothenate kinase
MDMAITEFDVDVLGATTVSVSSEELLTLVGGRKPMHILNAESNLPFDIKYETPETLGPDRIAGVLGVWSKNTKINHLVVDIGTCITYDFLSSENEYFGGSISPGLDMRLKSLHYFTANLPRVEEAKNVKLIGTTTESSIKSGVYSGILHEITGVINEYKNRFTSLQITITGGDLQLFSEHFNFQYSENSELVLFGINKFLHYQNL